MEMKEVIEIVKSVSGVSEERKAAVIKFLEGVEPERRGLALEMNGFPQKPVKEGTQFAVVYRQGDTTEFTEVPCVSYDDVILRTSDIQYHTLEKNDLPYEIMSVVSVPGEEPDVFYWDSTYPEDLEDVDYSEDED